MLDENEIGKYALRGATESAVWDALKAVVAERPDFVYQSPERNAIGPGPCFYVHTDAAGNREPGCGIGAMLIHLGADPERLREYEHNSALVVLSAFAPGMSAESRTALARFQERQDRGMSWGDALKSAEAYYLYLKAGVQPR